MKIEHRVRREALAYWRMLKQDEDDQRRFYLQARQAVKVAIRSRKQLKSISLLPRLFILIVSSLVSFNFRMFMMTLRTGRTMTQMVLDVYAFEKLKYNCLLKDLESLEHKYGF